LCGVSADGGGGEMWSLGASNRGFVERDSSGD